MTRKTTEAYKDALEYVNENLIELQGRGMITDFEKAMRSALHQVVPDLKTYGCWFHYCQALRRKMASMKELFELVKRNSKCYTIFRKFQCLALLPHEMIQAAFIELCKEALKESNLFCDFIDYMDKEWMQIVKPQNFSVFMLDTRTTSGAESYNSKLGQSFRTHGNLFHFIESLQAEETVSTEILQLHVEGTIQKSNKKKIFEKRSKLIIEYSEKLNAGDIKPKLFLNIMANLKNEVIFGDDEISIEVDEIEVELEMKLMEGDELTEESFVLHYSEDEEEDDEQKNLANLSIESGHIIPLQRPGNYL